MERSWWSKKWGRNRSCGITLSRLRAGKDKYGRPYVTRLKCGHAFYTKALDEWICTCPTEPATCPCCREEIVKLPI
jgi:hypothetical protein